MNSLHPFYSLTADKVIDSVERAMLVEKKGARATGRALALNSLENRVYEIEFEDHSFVVAKFFRPGRWTSAQILEEHAFLKRLSDAEVPVVNPFKLCESDLGKLVGENTLAKTTDGIFFCVFPKVRGRLSDELSKSQLETLGRYLGRVHQIGRAYKHKVRKAFSLEAWVGESLEYLLKSKFLDAHSRPHYERQVLEFLKLAKLLFKNVEMISVHGDCHLGNVLWQGEAPYLLDFDDTMLAPAVQDIWMVVRGRDALAETQREELLTGYEQMCEFDYSQLKLIEILRGARIIHYSAWIARRFEDPSFLQAFPIFGSQGYWRSEMDSLIEICDLLNQTPS